MIGTPRTRITKESIRSLEQLLAEVADAMSLVDFIDWLLVTHVIRAYLGNSAVKTTPRDCDLDGALESASGRSSIKRCRQTQGALPQWAEMVNYL